MSARRAVAVAVACAAAVVASCTDLAVENKVSPDIHTVFSNPLSIEQTILQGFMQCYRSTEFIDLPIQAAALSLEGLASSPLSLARLNAPRGPLGNSPGNIPFSGEFTQLSLNARLQANGVAALESLVKLGGTLGAPQQNVRARAFAYFAIGCNQGYLAMYFDSAAIITPALPRDSIPPLSGSSDVMASAIAMLDSATAISLSADTTKTGGFPLPTTWLSTNANLSRMDFVRLVRAYRARFRAGVARTPAERAAVNWAAVILDADSSITSDFTINVSSTTNNTWWIPYAFGASPHLAMFYHGMADTSGAFDVWLSTPLEQRSAFLIQTPDLRFPQGATRAIQQNSWVATTSLASRPYIRNRSAADPIVPSYAAGWYEGRRLSYMQINANTVTGGYPIVTRAEVNLLAAEGYYRQNNLAAAASRIDITRVGKGNLPALTGVVTTTTQLVPGAGKCVPRVPQGPTFTSTVCGTLWEALKWEKRLETAFTGQGQWYFDSRGWGDLIENTALEFPTPYQELLTRNLPYYVTGGGLRSSAAKGTYGY